MVRLETGIAVSSICATEHAQSAIKGRPSYFSKTVILAFPLAYAASDPVETFRRNYPDGFE
eukprot:30858-Pyramimonas_sp.AAC.1